MNKKVSFISPKNSRFESSYLQIRNIENRIYSNEKVALLPYLDRNDPHFKEWKLRAKTLERFLPYLTKRHENSSLLEIGCGNGWFSSRCASVVKSVTAIDVNETELKQAASVFDQDNLSFCYWDIFTPSPSNETFDCIVLNASIQYFPDGKKLIERLKELLSDDGEIHILDSPFYSAEVIKEAKERSDSYYQEQGVEEMSAYYFHHSKTVLENFVLLYSASNHPIIKRITRDSPFNWYCYRKG